MMRIVLAALAFALSGGAPAQAPQPAAPMQLWRLDCGEFVIKQYGEFFSDTFQYPRGPKTVVASCYLIRHGNNYMLWDTGLTDRLVGRKFENAAQTLTVKRSILDQLRQIAVDPAQIVTIGISHWHFDHVGQAARFPNAKLLIGKEDAALLRGPNPADKDSAEALAPWLTGGGNMEEITGDKDVFGDGRVVMLNLPGHTPGHHALLVRLASGPVLLSGDQYHFTEQVKNQGVPPFNHNRADTLASHDRFDRIAANLKAKVIIQHEPDDIGKLPAFPAGAK